MPNRSLRFTTLLLAALGLTMGAAHVLELAPKLRYDGALYTAVNSTMYRYYGALGGPLQVAAVLAAAALAWRSRGRPGGRSSAAGALLLVLSLVLWAMLVLPVNAAWGRVLASSPAAAPELYLRLRDRWEYGHVAAFSAWLAGFVVLLWSAVFAVPGTGGAPARPRDPSP